MKRLTLLVLATLAACGSKPAKPVQPSSPTDPAPTGEPATATPVEPATPATPARPAEPAKPDPAQLKAELLASEKAAFENAKPVFDKWCAKCHTKGGAKASQKKLDHFDMSTYPFGGHHAMEISGQIRKSLAIGGGKPSMPFDKKGALSNDELALIAAWADAFDAAHKGGAHEGHGDHHGGHRH